MLHHCHLKSHVVIFAEMFSLACPTYPVKSPSHFVRIASLFADLGWRPSLRAELSGHSWHGLAGFKHQDLYISRNLIQYHLFLLVFSASSRNSQLTWQQDGWNLKHQLWFLPRKFQKMSSENISPSVRFSANGFVVKLWNSSMDSQMFPSKIQLLAWKLWIIPDDMCLSY